jgi:hypothetical protein
VKPHIETISDSGAGSAKYRIPPPPIVPQLATLPTAHANANATTYLKIRDIGSIDHLRYAVRGVSR